MRPEGLCQWTVHAEHAARNGASCQTSPRVSLGTRGPHGRWTQRSQSTNRFVISRSLTSESLLHFLLVLCFRTVSCRPIVSPGAEGEPRNAIWSGSARPSALEFICAYQTKAQSFLLHWLVPQAAGLCSKSWNSGARCQQTRSSGARALLALAVFDSFSLHFKARESAGAKFLVADRLILAVVEPSQLQCLLNRLVHR